MWLRGENVVGGTPARKSLEIWVLKSDPEQFPFPLLSLSFSSVNWEPGFWWPICKKRGRIKRKSINQIKKMTWLLLNIPYFLLTTHLLNMYVCAYTGPSLSLAAVRYYSKSAVLGSWWCGFTSQLFLEPLICPKVNLFPSLSFPDHKVRKFGAPWFPKTVCI